MQLQALIDLIGSLIPVLPLLLAINKDVAQAVSKLVSAPAISSVARL